MQACWSCERHTAGGQPREVALCERIAAAGRKGDCQPRVPSGSPALLFFADQELWLCGPASQRVCPSTLAEAETYAGSVEKTRCTRNDVTRRDITHGGQSAAFASRTDHRSAVRRQKVIPKQTGPDLDWSADERMSALRPHPGLSTERWPRQLWCVWSSLRLDVSLGLDPAVGVREGSIAGDVHAGGAGVPTAFRGGCQRGEHGAVLPPVPRQLRVGRAAAGALRRGPRV
jgi:hypothetical protein